MNILVSIVLMACLACPFAGANECIKPAPICGGILNSAQTLANPQARIDWEGCLCSPIDLTIYPCADWCPLSVTKNPFMSGCCYNGGHQKK